MWCVKGITIKDNDNTDLSPVSKEKFISWLITEGKISQASAQHYISYIHKIEKIYSSIFGTRKKIIGAVSSESAKLRFYYDLKDIEE